MNEKEIIIISIFTLVIVILTILMFNLFTQSMFDAVTEIQCCSGVPCSDTYYTPLDNKCHLVSCENDISANKSDCVYEGANQSINYLG